MCHFEPFENAIYFVTKYCGYERLTCKCHTSSLRGILVCTFCTAKLITDYGVRFRPGHATKDLMVMTWFNLNFLGCLLLSGKGNSQV